MELTLDEVVGITEKLRQRAAIGCQRVQMPNCDHLGCPAEADFDAAFCGYGQEHRMMLCGAHAARLSWHWPVIVTAYLHANRRGVRCRARTH